MSPAELVPGSGHPGWQPWPCLTPICSTLQSEHKTEFGLGFGLRTGWLWWGWEQWLASSDRAAGEGIVSGEVCLTLGYDFEHPAVDDVPADLSVSMAPNDANFSVP